jgi:hypothetical protein
MAMRRREDDEVYPNAAAIDVGASSHWVAVPRTADDQPVREFGTMTADLHAMADWLLACGVDTVALESTGVYWIPVYEVLEQRGLTVWLVDARQMKYVPGRKSDVQDCQWLQKLMSLGLLRAAWRPAGEVCVVRAIVRQRELLLTEQGSWIQRMQKALVQMNLQLTEVLTDVMGATGQAIIRAIVAGERDPKVLARFRHPLVKASTEDVIRALTGNWREEHLFVLAQALAMFDRGAAGPAVAARRRADRTGQEAPEEHSPVRRAYRARALGGRGPDAHQRPVRGNRDDDPLRDRPGPEPLRQRQALLFLAAPVPRHEDQWGQDAVFRHPTLRQPRPAGTEAGGHEPGAQRLGARRVLPPAVRPHGQAARQYRGGPQACPHGVLHAHARRSLRRPGAAAL